MPAGILTNIVLCIRFNICSFVSTGGDVCLPPARSPKEFDTIYNMVRTDNIFMLKHSDLELAESLGKGNFGSVMRGTYHHRGAEIDVAVKVLKTNDAAAEVSTIFCFMLQ